MAGLEAMACSMACWLSVAAMLALFACKRVLIDEKKSLYCVRVRESVLVGGVFCCGRAVVSHPG